MPEILVFLNIDTGELRFFVDGVGSGPTADWTKIGTADLPLKISVQWNEELQRYQAKLEQ